MKTRQFVLLFTLFVMSPIGITMTVVEDNTEVSTNNAVITDFGLTGTIDSYNAADSLIRINGKNYILIRQGNISKIDLVAGKKINYNLEQSAEEELGRITRVWATESE